MREILVGDVFIEWVAVFIGVFLLCRLGVVVVQNPGTVKPNKAKSVKTMLGGTCCAT